MIDAVGLARGLIEAHKSEEAREIDQKCAAIGGDILIAPAEEAFRGDFAQPKCYAGGTVGRAVGSEPGVSGRSRLAWRPHGKLKRRLKLLFCYTCATPWTRSERGTPFCRGDKTPILLAIHYIWTGT